MLPLLAYQKIYYDFFSNSQWEKHLAFAYNVDYWSGSGSISLAVNMVKLRYANYPKDYFMGMLPSSQYGSVATLRSQSAAFVPNRVVFSPDETIKSPASGLSSVANSKTVQADSTSTSARSAYVAADLSALSIRATEYLQRWKEVVQFSSKDYSDQMAAQFGIKAPEYMGNHAHYIGGCLS